MEQGARKEDVAVKYGIPASTDHTILKTRQTVITAIESNAPSGSTRD